MPKSAMISGVLAVGIVVAAAGWWTYEDVGYRASLNRAVALTGGDPGRAKALMIAHGCGGCHRIPGIPGAHGLVGPELERLRDRVYIAGVLSNTPDNLAAWIRDARSINPKTAMPRIGISDQEARDIAAYLYAR